jgi:ATP-binding cassette subfamily B protein/subfamily B ATP-binding cassette protein MsbA
MNPEIKTILRELKPFKKTITIIAIAGVFVALSEGQMAVQLKRMTDSLQTGRTSDILWASFIIIMLALILSVSRYFHIYLMNVISEKVTIALRQKLQSKFMNLNLTFHHNYASGSGGLISRILHDINIIKDGLRMVADFFREPLLFIFLMTWLFILNWKLTSTIIIVLPFVLFILRKLSIGIRKHGEESQQMQEKLTSTIKESLDGVRIIQSFNLESHMRKRFEEQSDEFLDARKKIHRRVEFSGPLTEFIATILILSLFMYMGLAISKGEATYGDFMSYIASLLMLNKPIKKLQESYVRIQESIVAIRRVYTLIDEKSEIIKSENPKPFPHNWKTIEYKNVSFAYGQDLVLKNFNLTLTRGQMVALVGTSGSGKSTVVNLLERFYEPTSGVILIDGINLKDFDLHDLRQNMSLVSQDVFLFSDTIKTNIWSGDFAKSPDLVPMAAKSANAHDFIMRNPLGYESLVGDKGALLSGGEKQRISIARALFKDAPILILDEATSALDSSSEIEVQKGLDHLMEGRTSLVIAHRLSTIIKADKIIVMKAGYIVETGTHDELISHNGEYARFQKLQKI